MQAYQVNVNVYQKKYVSYAKIVNSDIVDKAINDTFIFDDSDMDGVVEATIHSVLCYLAYRRDVDPEEVKKDASVKMHCYDLSGTQRTYIEINWSQYDLMVVVDFKQV